MALTKIYRVALLFYFKQIRYFDLGSRISGVVTQSSEKDFENKFPTDDELDSYIKEQKQIAINRLGDNFEYLKNETTITEFLKYIPSTLDILSQSKSLHNEYASLSPDAKTISSEEQKIRDEEKILERDRKEENGEEITEDDF